MSSISAYQFARSAMIGAPALIYANPVEGGRPLKAKERLSSVNFQSTDLFNILGRMQSIAIRGLDQVVLAGAAKQIFASVRVHV